MIRVKVTFENEDHLVTNINTDLAGAREYYIGHIFTLSTGRVKATSVELVQPISCTP